MADLRSLFLLPFSSALIMVLFYALLNPGLCASTTPVAISNSAFLEKLHIKGLHRTKLHVVKRELEVSEGQWVTADQILKSVQNLKNTDLFSKVLPLTEIQTNSHLILTLELEERWTTIPFFNFSSGGSTNYILAGIYDTNFLGRFIQFGVQYDNWNGAHSGLLWYRNPHFFSRKTRLAFDIGTIKRPWIIYTATGDKIFSYLLARNVARLSITHELPHAIFFDMGFFDHQDSYQNPIATPGLESATEQILGADRNFSFREFDTSLRFGELARDNFLVSGYEVSMRHTRSLGFDLSSHHFQRNRFTAKIFQTFWRDASLGAQLKIFQSNASMIHKQYVLGGFGEIRGYFDGQFQGKLYWQTNLEFRKPVFEYLWFILQGIVFFDALQYGNTAAELGLGQTLYTSQGIGVRLISPKVYGFNGRLDFSWANSATKASAISFGAQQFF